MNTRMSATRTQSMNLRAKDKSMDRYPQTVVFALALIALAGLSGCALGPDYQRPELQVPVEYREGAAWKEAAPADVTDKGDWWSAYGDQRLNDLQEQALTANQSLKAAVARVSQARAAARIGESELFPNIDLNPAALRLRSAGGLRSMFGNSSASPLRAAARA